MAQENTISQTSATSSAKYRLDDALSGGQKKILEHALSRLSSGRFEVTLPDGQVITHTAPKEGIFAQIRIFDKTMLSDVMARGDIGLGETYINGDWHSPDLFNFLRFCIENADDLGPFADGSPFRRFIWRIVNSLLRANSKSGSKKNISVHYDVGNSFYEGWLDKTMTYSAALYKTGSETLEQAQYNKYQAILDQFDEGTKTVLEIGCGWGGFVEHAAAKNYDVSAVTISQEQYKYACKRNGDNANIMLRDYRDLTGQYDAIASIEMFEAVGEKYWDIYFEKVAELLRMNGKAVIQTITIRDDLFDDYRMRSDFIRHYIFPGGMLPSSKVFKEKAAQAGLKCINAHMFGQDYAKTLLLWAEKFSENKSSIIHEKGVTFYRSWYFYLIYCAAAFSCGRIDVGQFTLQK